MGNKRVPELRFAGVAGDWERRKLGQLIKISSAARVHKNEWTTSGVRFFRSSDVVSSFIGKKNIPAYISYSLYDELSKKSGLVQPGDLLVTGGGSIGIPYLVTDQEPLYFKDADLIWFKSANKIDGYFLYYYFVTSQLRKYISSITHIGTISHYTIEQAKDTPIVLPKQVEQNLIGNLFKQLDDTIALHQQELTTLKQTKQGFLQKMFPKEGKSVPEVRFSGFTGNWEQRKLREMLAEPVTDGPHETPKLEESGIPFISVDAIVDNQIDFDRKRGYISEETDELYSKKYRPQYHDVFLVKSGSTVGKTAIVETKERFNIWSPLAAMRVGEVSDPYFLYFLLQTRKMQNQVKDKASSGTQPNLGMRELEKFHTQITPNLEEQKKIGAFFQQLDNLITLHQRELEALKKTKKAFLQKMFV
ncbi:restriction endonuclease subunit S [Bacillus amyloliquefaciens]|uniref:restriction endonuclease subunit S n=1 Tax=Bacillus amyloliquefaciens TaxID=1390 RepID=UPI003C75D54E